MRRLSAKHRLLLWTAGGAEEAGLVLRAAVNGTRGVFPAQRRGQCLARAREAAFQLCVLECDHACAGWSNGRCRGTLTAPMAEALTRGSRDSEWVLNPADRYGTKLL